MKSRLTFVVAAVIVLVGTGSILAILYNACKTGRHRMVCACFHDPTPTEDRARLDLPRGADASRQIFVWAAASGASRPNDGRSDEEADNPLVADDRNFYKWSKAEEWPRGVASLREPAR